MIFKTQCKKKKKKKKKKIHSFDTLYMKKTHMHISFIDKKFPVLAIVQLPK